jgi:hypothetical protein
MTGLWTNDRDTLADGLMELDWVQWAASRLISTGVVRVLDPNNTELRKRVRKVVTSNELDTESRITAVIEALRQP